MMRRDGPLAILGLLGCGLACGIVALTQWWPGPGLRRTPPGAVSGDEPHYLLTLGSILFDGDLDLREDYGRVRRGLPAAGAAFRSRALDHHTIVVDRDTGAHQRWHSLYDSTRPEECAPAVSCAGFRKLAPGFDGPRIAEPPAHPPAFPLLMALLVLPLRPTPDDLEQRAGAVLWFIDWLAVVATWLCARRSGLGPRASLAAAALLCLASPWLAYTRAYYAETMIGLALILGLWALQAERRALAGLAAAVAMWLKPNFAATGAAWAVERWLAGDRRGAAVIAGVVGAAAAALVVFNERLADVALIAGTYGWIWASDLGAFWGSMFGADHGLVTFAPWVAIPLASIGRGIASLRRSALLRQIALPSLAQLAILSASGLGGGTCYGPRMWVPFLPLFALAAVHVTATAGAAARAALIALAAFSLLISIPAALRYAHSFERPPLAALIDR